MGSMVAKRLTQITPPAAHQINFGNVWKLIVNLVGCDDGFHQENVMLQHPPEYLSPSTPPGRPPSKLILKLVHFAMLLRNLCITNGLCKDGYHSTRTKAMSDRIKRIAVYPRYIAAVIPKCIGDPPVNRDRLNAHPGFMDFPEAINSIVVVKIPNPTDISLVWVPF
ncbi:hypothetical protein TNCV_4519311 [Trichonephila clavipes]|nr:hypothetical protein TNCV_4519311 [Trichonephila clavipes]